MNDNKLNSDEKLIAQRLANARLLNREKEYSKLKRKMIKDHSSTKALTILYYSDILIERYMKESKGR